MLSTLISIALCHLPSVATLKVGPGKEFARIEDAVARASSGDTILVYPDPSGYPRTALRIQVASLTIRGIGLKPVAVTGQGFDYSGSGSAPRAIIQVEPGGEKAKIENLDLSGAHNQSFNGAGVRIQAASDVTVRDCAIHDNDMGIMSNGKEGDPKAASNQLVEYCLIERNGNTKDPGYNHNLYLGGTSVFLSHCEVRNSTTGHNIKSRAHYIEIKGCYVHDAANREIDLPEAWDTSQPNSNAVLIGNRIVKDPYCPGNREVIHFGREKGTREGSIYLYFNTIVTPFASPVLDVTTSKGLVVASENTFLNLQQDKASLFQFLTKDMKVTARKNHVSLAYLGLGEDNTTSMKKSDLFGLSAPDYAFVVFPQSPMMWQDGNAELVTGTPARSLFNNVGPRQK